MYYEVSNRRMIARLEQEAAVEAPSGGIPAQFAARPPVTQVLKEMVPFQNRKWLRALALSGGC